jgi:hypothetical protein
LRTARSMLTPPPCLSRGVVIHPMPLVALVLYVRGQGLFFLIICVRHVRIVNYKIIKRRIRDGTKNPPETAFHTWHAVGILNPNSTAT